MIAFSGTSRCLEEAGLLFAVSRKYSSDILALHSSDLYVLSGDAFNCAASERLCVQLLEAVSPSLYCSISLELCSNPCARTFHGEPWHSCYEPSEPWPRELPFEVYRTPWEH